MAVGGALWGNCNWGWGGGDVDINVSEYNEFNRTDISNKNWEHKPEHRKGTEYRDKRSQEKFGGKRDAAAAKSRDSFRGRAEQGRQQIAKGDAKDFQRGGSRDRPGAGQARPADRSAGAGRPSAGTQRPAAGSRERASSGMSKRGGSFDGVGSGKQVRSQSSRGHASRASSMGSSRGGGGFGGGGRGGGGGGGRGGGGGGRRR
jgi:hypothetical protein